MLLTEYDEAKQMELFRRDGIEEGKEIGRKEGREEGRKEGEDKFATLTNDLISRNRMDDLQKAATDKEARRLLYIEFGLNK